MWTSSGLLPACGRKFSTSTRSRSSVTYRRVWSPSVHAQVGCPASLISIGLLIWVSSYQHRLFYSYPAQVSAGVLRCAFQSRTCSQNSCPTANSLWLLLPVVAPCMHLMHAPYQLLNARLMEVLFLFTPCMHACMVSISSVCSNSSRYVCRVCVFAPVCHSLKSVLLAFKSGLGCPCLPYPFPCTCRLRLWQPSTAHAL